MKLIKSLPCAISSGGHMKSMAVFWCEYCKNEVVRRRNSGLESDSCGCMKTKKLRLRKTTERSCLKCEEKFQSAGAHNRLCVGCQQENESTENQGHVVRVKHREYLSGHQHAPKI